MKEWLQKLLFDWVFVLLYRMLQGLLNLVEFIESFFDVFAGTAKIFYKGDADFLLNVFFGHDAVTNAFWAMALIAIVLAFAFCIVQMARKATDISGTVRQSVGQTLSNFFRCLLIILLLNAGTVAAINISNVMLDRINFALENATILNQSEDDKTFTEQEYTTMTKILATVANYSVNPSADSRYNVNSCFNAIRPDLLSLHVNGFFDYDYPLDDNGHYTWQGALALLASSADLTQDLNLSTYYTDVVSAFQTVSKEISTYSEFAPIKSAHFSAPGVLETDDLIFLIVGMEAAQNSMYNTGNFYDSIRKGYISGDKSYNNLTQVRKDFDIWEMDYLVGYISCITFILIMAICIFTFIVRIFNILLLYITAPLFVSSMPLDDGSKWNSWVQAFVIQLFSGFGLVISMRLYLIIIPIVISSDLVFFAGTGTANAILNHMAQLLMVLGGAWAVLQSGGVITGILAGNPGMAAIQQEGRMGAMVTGWAMRAPRAAMENTGKLVGKAIKGGKHLAETGERHRQKADKKADLASRKAQQRQNMADSKFAAAGRKATSGASDRSVNRSMSSANRAQRSADRAIKKADGLNMAAGRKPTGIGPSSGMAAGGRSGLSGGNIHQSSMGQGHGPQGGGMDLTGGHSGGHGGGDNNMPPPPRNSSYLPDASDTNSLGVAGSASVGMGASTSGGPAGHSSGTGGFTHAVPGGSAVSQRTRTNAGAAQNANRGTRSQSSSGPSGAGSTHGGNSAPNNSGTGDSYLNGSNNNVGGGAVPPRARFDGDPDSGSAPVSPFEPNSATAVVGYGSFSNFGSTDEGSGSSYDRSRNYDAPPADNSFADNVADSYIDNGYGGSAYADNNAGGNGGSYVSGYNSGSAPGNFSHSGGYVSGSNHTGASGGGHSNFSGANGSGYSGSSNSMPPPSYTRSRGNDSGPRDSSSGNAYSASSGGFSNPTPTGSHYTGGSAPSGGNSYASPTSSDAGYARGRANSTPPPSSGNMHTPPPASIRRESNSGVQNTSTGHIHSKFHTNPGSNNSGTSGSGNGSAPPPRRGDRNKR